MGLGLKELNKMEREEGIEWDLHSEDGIQEYLQFLSMAFWNIPYMGDVTMVKRKWKSLNGRFQGFTEGIHYDQIKNSQEQEGYLIDPTPNVIEVSAYWDYRTNRKRFKETLAHELIHWYIYMLGLDQRDTSYYFVWEVVIRDANISGTKKAQAAYHKALEDSSFLRYCKIFRQELDKHESGPLYDYYLRHYRKFYWFCERFNLQEEFDG